MSELTELTVQNPVEEFLRMDRIPHIWCPGCGIGTSVNSFAHALIDAKIDTRNVAIVPVSVAPDAWPATSNRTHSTPRTAARFPSPPG